MKKVLTIISTLFIISHSFAQKMEEANKSNSWLKLGLSASVPVGNISNYTSFAGGLELSGQFMETKHVGIGIATGYTEFFAKSGFNSFGAIPLGVMFRYYPMHDGFFAGADLGYTFLTGSGPSGGFYMKPQLGYHNYDWNLYAFYNQVFLSSGNADVQNIGVAATYNIRFK